LTRRGDIRIGWRVGAIDRGADGIRGLGGACGRRGVCGCIEVGVFSVWGDWDERVFVAGHGEVVRVCGIAAAFGQWAVAVAGLGGGVAVADADGVVIDVLFILGEVALAGDQFEVLGPPFLRVRCARGVWYPLVLGCRSRSPVP
jgi:hypothetical protein